MIPTILTLIVQLLPGILQETGMSANMSTLIAKLGGAIPGLITSLTAGKGATADFMAILAALKQEIAVLAATTNLSPKGLEMVASLDNALAAALAGYAAAQTKTDPNSLTDLPETLPIA